METLHATLVQMRCEKGEAAANLAAIESYLDEAAGCSADVVCFPEASLTGYVNERQHPGSAVRVDGPEVARLLSITRAYPALVAIVGIVEANPAGPSYLTQLAARDGRLLAVYRKRTIPDDETDLYTSGTKPVTFMVGDVRCGLAICADIESPAVFADCAAAGAQVVFECAAPGLYGAQETRDWASGYDWWRGECHTKLGRYACEQGIYVAVATQAGRTRDEDFPGGGYLFGADGACLAESGDWREGTIDVTIPIAEGRS